jgi:chromate transporter
MSDWKMLGGLAGSFGLLSLQAVGGGTAVLPEMQRLVEGTYHIKPDDFAQIYSLGQLAPGPNMLMVVVLGDRIAGVAGAIVVLLSFFIPASILCFGAGRLWDRVGESPWRRAVQNGLAPISIGLMASGVYSLGKFATTTWLTIGLAIGMIALILRTKINPTLLILACAVFGAFFLPRT